MGRHNLQTCAGVLPMEKLCTWVRVSVSGHSAGLNLPTSGKRADTLWVKWEIKERIARTAEEGDQSLNTRSLLAIYLFRWMWRNKCYDVEDDKGRS